MGHPDKWEKPPHFLPSLFLFFGFLVILKKFSREEGVLWGGKIPQKAGAPKAHPAASALSKSWGGARGAEILPPLFGAP